MAQIEPKIGMKVKLIRGDMDSKPPFGFPDPTLPRLNTVHWIAGTVQVGSIGEVYEHVIHEWMKPDNPSRSMFALKFDGITPKSGYVFGIGYDGLDAEAYEVIQ